MQKPRVLIADDHAIVADGLYLLLRDEFDVVGAARDGSELLELATQTRPDVIVTDISMPSLNGIDAIRQMRTGGCTAKFIVLTQHKDANVAAEAFRVGASGFVLKHAAGQELADAIREVVQGRSYLTPLIAKDLIGLLLDTQPQDNSNDGKLTVRQRETLQLFAEGRTAKEVAASLGISTRTAEGHKYEIMSILGAKTSAELVQHAIRLGLIGI
jgi:DNA-binding NarL/FixJ family response regulator